MCFMEKEEDKRDHLCLSLIIFIVTKVVKKKHHTENKNLFYGPGKLILSYVRITGWQGRTKSESVYLGVKYDNIYLNVKYDNDYVGVKYGNVYLGVKYDNPSS